ncbi:hypothetical protein [Desulfosporosinus hippei]|uniref:ABC-2 family transporter protein n=1 Tax=Desulfosporosinus hippei DSM 8344 TaxID=1121419 RepID=A0A1G8LR47_9FIRM|nr:hypothetical protein [Desulfosporosinus hippei]SDI58154.1 hypothetical protein SAMN05443529_1537 [Desulfosporosinus hippei DSM 8344]
MGTLLKMELLNCINRKQFKIVFIGLFAINTYAFIYTCFIVKGMGLSGLRSGYEMSILLHPYSQAILMTIIFMLPMIANVIYSDSFITDIKSGTYIFITTRSSRTTYIISKGLAVIISTFVSFLIPLLFNIILSNITFPSINYETNGLPPYVIEYIPEELFNWLRIGNPFLFSMTSVTIIALFASMYALLGYSISLNLRKNSLIPIAIVMLAYLVIDIFVSLLPNGLKFQLTILPLPTSPASPTYFFSAIILIFILSISLILRYLLHSRNEL